MPEHLKRASGRHPAASLFAAGALSLGRPMQTFARDPHPRPRPPRRPASRAPPRQPGRASRPGPSRFHGHRPQDGPAVVNVSVVGPAGSGGSPAAGRTTSSSAASGVRQPQPRGGQIDPRRGLGVHRQAATGSSSPTRTWWPTPAEVTVRLTDKREFRAKVVGVDKDTDVAVLKIDARDLPTVRIGDASRAQVGEWVLAIGSPFGFENSVTAGVISARARSLPGEGYIPFLQTDVAVNPGNSGGPLFNLAGEVIGINSQIYSGSGGYMGISFAIPINVAMKVQQQLLATGKVTRGRIGVAIQDVDQQLARSFGLPRPDRRAGEQRREGRARRRLRPEARRRDPGAERAGGRQLRRPAAPRGRHPPGRDRQAEGVARRQGARRRGEGRRDQGRRGGGLERPGGRRSAAGSGWRCGR